MSLMMIYSSKHSKNLLDIDVVSRFYKSDGRVSLRHSWIRSSVCFFGAIITRKNFVALADQLIVSSSNFLTSVIIGRACVKEEFGLYMLGFTIVVFMRNWQNSLIFVPYTVYSQRLKGTIHAQYTGSCLIQQLALSILFSLILVILGLIFSSGIGPVGLANVTRALALFIIFILLREYVRSICFATMSMINAFVLDCCITVLQIGGLLLLVKFRVLSAQYAYWVVGIVCGIISLSWLILNRQKLSLEISHAVSDFWKNWSLGKWLFGSQMAFVLSIEIFPWLIAIFHGTSATAIFAACRSIVNLVNPFLLGSQNYLIPATNRALANGGIKEMHRIVMKYSIYFALIGGAISILIIWIGESLIVIAYGDKYAGNGLVLSLLTLFVFVRLMAIPFSIGLISMEIADKDLMSNILGLLVVCTFGLWITKFIGANGAAIGLIVSGILSTFAKYIYYNRKLQRYSSD